MVRGIILVRSIPMFGRPMAEESEAHPMLTRGMMVMVVGEEIRDGTGINVYKRGGLRINDQ